MPYNREQARKYASAYAWKVCHDGSIAVDGSKLYEKAKPGSKMSLYDFSDENDCTHYISCCIGDHGGIPFGSKKRTGIPGGGLKITLQTAIQKGYGCSSAPKMVAYLLKNHAKLVGTEKMRVTKSVTELAQHKSEKGDLIAYAETKTGGYKHMAFNLWHGYISCHTDCRYGDQFTAIHWKYVTLLKITS